MDRGHKTRSDKILRKILKEDLSERNHSKTQLYTFKDLRVKDWDFSLSTIASTQTQILKNSIITDIQSFRKEYNVRFSAFLKELDYKNILIAGGAISATILKAFWLDSDVDIFIYGLNEEEANAKVEQTVNSVYSMYKSQLLNEYKEKNPNTKLTDDKVLEIISQTDVITTRSENCISINLGKIEVQIIFRLYKSKEEILLGFDLGSSAVGYDGKEVYFTGLGKFAYEYLSNIVDPSRRSTTYEYRLKKYYERGFHIILPELDIKTLRTDYFRYNRPEIAMLPYLPFSYSDIRGKRIVLDEFLVDISKNKYACDTSDYVKCDADDSAEYSSFYWNLKSLAKGESKYYYFSNTLDAKAILDVSPHISASRVMEYYDQLSHNIYNKCNFNIRIFLEYFSPELLPKILKSITSNNSRNDLDELIEAQKELVLSRLDEQERKNDNSIRWMKTNPGTQISGSFNPIISNSEDWYHFE